MEGAASLPPLNLSGVIPKVRVFTGGTRACSERSRRESPAGVEGGWIVHSPAGKCKTLAAVELLHDIVPIEHSPCMSAYRFADPFLAGPKTLSDRSSQQ